MALNINSSSLNLSQNQVAHYNTNVKSSQNTDETEKTSSSMASRKLQEDESASTDDNSITETSEHGDTVTLSKEGMQKAQSGAPTGGAKLLSEAAVTESSSSSSSDDLSSYSDAQLKSKLSSGEITQAQYNSEITRRASESSEITDATTLSLQLESSKVSQLLN